MQMNLFVRDLRLKHPFTIARGTTTIQPMLIVELSQDGHRGYGEAPDYAFYGASIESITQALENVRGRVEAYDLRKNDPQAMWAMLNDDLSSESFAACALDMAAHDLWGKLHGKGVYELWGLDPSQRPKTDITIGIDTVEKMVSKLREDPEFDIYKIKLGTPQDIQIITELRKHTEATFRVDANCAWTVQQTIDNAKLLKPLGVEFIEQPLPRDQWEGMKRVFAESALPIIADESCMVEEDVARCCGLFHGVNVKLVKCGGMTPARRMLQEARSLGLRTMMGCMSDSTITASSIAQFLPMLDYVDMDGPLLIAEDIATGVKIDPDGTVHYAACGGNGVTLMA